MAVLEDSFSRAFEILYCPSEYHVTRCMVFDYSIRRSCNYITIPGSMLSLGASTSDLQLLLLCCFEIYTPSATAGWIASPTSDFLLCSSTTTPGILNNNL